MISLILNTLLIKNNVTIYTTLILLLLIYNKFEFRKYIVISIILGTLYSALYAYVPIYIILFILVAIITRYIFLNIKYNYINVVITSMFIIFLYTTLEYLILITLNINCYSYVYFITNLIYIYFYNIIYTSLLYLLMNI